MNWRISAIVATALLCFAAGCSTDTELSGVRVPNSRPDTRITGQPPSLIEAGFAVTLNWTGSDSDGLIVGYEWKISNNGVDGISPRDTLTNDPLTGAVLNPWRFTAANDSTFLVMADQDSFARDTYDPRSFRTHSVFLRAVDDKGAVDPTPAYISFTSTTIVPTCRVVYPDLSNQTSMAVPTTVNVGWTGTDPDFELNVPTQVRFLWRSAIYDYTDDGEPLFIRTPAEYRSHGDGMIDFDDPNWSEWRGYDPVDTDRRAKFPDQPDKEYFLFAVQVRDTAGAVSVGTGYNQEVANFRIRAGGFRPAVTITEPFLGSPNSSEVYNEIAGGQPLNFSWVGSADHYNGEIESYRHGWDLIDPDDPSDPGWAVPPGLSKQNLFATERSFQNGLHTFYLKVLDDSNQERLITWSLEVIPFVSRVNQFELLVIDQVYDPWPGTNNWEDRGGTPRNGENFRNPYWHFLAEGSGGVDGVTWERDFSDHTQNVRYADVVDYKVVLCFAKSNNTYQLMFSQFRPRDNINQFVWLAPYQEGGGNFFLVGENSMDSFLEDLSNYMVPVLFDSRQPIFVVDGNTYVTGFGLMEQPDGNFIQRGPLLYPYATAGIAAFDWTSIGTKTIYGRSNPVKFDRRSDCVGLKALVLDPDFKNNHGIGPGVIADTMFTNPEIDWHDVVDQRADTLALYHEEYQYNFRNDEFYDSNISTRSEPIILQECSEVLEAPGGLCIEPMYRGIARFDWLREIRYAEGEMDWPQSRYAENELDDACGTVGLTSYQGRDRSSGRTNGQSFGFFSYKQVLDKPVRKADVYWGFDPYRFDEAESKKAIRWVLQYFGLTINP